MTLATIAPTGEVHPAADAFPMLGDDELDALAADVAANGLREPVVLTPEGVLLDGRNRLAACERAGVAPSFTVYEGPEPELFVLSANVHRRHMTTGQRAAAVALVLERAGKRTNGRWAYGALVDSPDSVNASTWTNNLRQAGVVLDHQPMLLPLVLSGAKPLSAAYDEARSVAAAAESEQARMARLEANDAALAAQVREEALSLADAEAVLAAREKRRADDQRDALALLTRVLNLVVPDGADPAFVDTWAAHLGSLDSPTRARLKAASQTLASLEKGTRP